MSKLEGSRWIDIHLENQDVNKTTHGIYIPSNTLEYKKYRLQVFVSSYSFIFFTIINRDFSLRSVHIVSQSAKMQWIREVFLIRVDLLLPLPEIVSHLILRQPIIFEVFQVNALALRSSTISSYK